MSNTLQKASESVQLPWCQHPEPISAVIVNHNTRDDLRSCLSMLQTEPLESVIVVDNASNDGSVEMLKDEFPWVKLLANQDNPGYGAAANQAIRSCTTRYILLLNSDTLILPGAVSVLVTYLDKHPFAAVVGPRLLNPDGSLQISCFPFPNPLNQILAGTSLGKVAGSLPIVRERYLPAWSHMRPRSVPWVLGAAFAIRRSAFVQVHGFDESYFMYSEEVDLCFRFRAAGWQVHFTPAASVIHTGGASTAQYLSDMEVQKYTSTRLFYQRHYPKTSLLLLRLFVTYTMIRNLARDNIRLSVSQSKEQRAKILSNLKLEKRILSETWKELI